MSIESARGVQPLVDTRWLGLPVSARGLADELQKYADENGRVALRLREDANADAIGSEIARLLCAHRGELARIRRDAQDLLDHNEIAVDGSLLRLCRFAHAHQAVQTLERSRAKTDAERQQHLRDREKASREQKPAASRNVTNVTAERDDFRDDRHDASVTRPFSFKNDLDLKSLKEREVVTAIVTTKRDAVPAQVNDARRANAKQLGLENHRIHLVWAGFVPKHAGQKRTEKEWDDRWEWWVANQLIMESAKAPAPATSVAKAADDEPSWIREAMGDK